MSFGSDSTPMPCTWHQASDQNEALLEPGEANMRRIIGNSLVSADGVVPDDPVGMGFADYYDDTYLRERLALFTMCDAILWGRTTYEVFSKMWAGKEKTHPYAARLIAIRKYVFSSTLENADWNNSTIIRGDVVAEVSKLKQREGAD